MSQKRKKHLGPASGGGIVSEAVDRNVCHAADPGGPGDKQPLPAPWPLQGGEIVPAVGEAGRQVRHEPWKHDVHRQEVENESHGNREEDLAEESVAQEAFPSHGDDELKVRCQASEDKREAREPLGTPGFQPEGRGLMGGNDPGQRAQPPVREGTLASETGLMQSLGLGCHFSVKKRFLF